MDRKWWTLTVVCAATFMLLLDVTIVVVALPTIQHDLLAPPRAVKPEAVPLEASSPAGRVVPATACSPSETDILATLPRW